MSSSSSRDISPEDKDKKPSFKKNKLFSNKTKPLNINNTKKNNNSKSSIKTSKKKKKTNNLKLNKLIYEVNIQRNIQLLRQNDYNVNNEQLGAKEKKDKLLIYFQGKKIYIEIYNGNENASNVFFELLLKYKIIQCKRLTKNIDYIIFKEGHLKTKRFAVMNNIKMVNPLWVDDKINRNIFKDDNEYLVKTNMGDILLQEKVDKDDKSKVFEHEIEAEFDENYANFIDRERELKEKENSKIKREKRKSKNPRRNNQIKFSTQEEAKKNNKMDIEQNNNNKENNENLKEEKKEGIEKKNDERGQTPIPMDLDEQKEKKKNVNKKIIEDDEEENNFKGLKKGENIENNENKNNPSDDEIIIIQNDKEEKKPIFEVITDIIHNNIQKNNEDENTIDLTNKKGKKIKSKTPFKIRIKPKYKKKIDTKLKSKDYKHKATFKNIMVTNVEETPIQNPNNLAEIQGLNKKEEDNTDNNKEIDDLNNTPDLVNKEKDKDKETEIINKTIGQKINIITYKLEEEEIQCLRTMDKFEYKGDLNNPLLDYGILYCSASVIILDKEKSKYDWKMYDFFFDKKILVDFASFLFEFITENTDIDKIDAKETLDKLNKISLNEETYFLNKKIRYQRRSLIHSLNIVENIAETKKEEKDEEKREVGINFVLNYNILSGEKRIIQRILKFYLKANVIKINLKEYKEKRDMRSKSVGPNIKFNFKVKKAQIEEKIKKIKDNKNSKNIKNNKFESIIKTRNQTKKTEEKNHKDNDKDQNIKIKKEKTETIEEIEIKSKNKKIDENEVLSILDNDLSKEEKIDFSKIKGDTYLLSKEKITNEKIFKKIPNFKGILNYKYAFDSFWAGKLLDLKNEHILKKYEFK